MDIKKIFAKIKKERAELFKADISNTSNLPTPELRESESAKETSEDNADKCNEEKPRRKKIEVPPNCYIDGKIKANFGTFTYAQIFKYTSRPLKIYNDGNRRMHCTLREPFKKCPTYHEYQTGQITKAMKDLACRDCWKSGGLTYFRWCNTVACDKRHNLHVKGLSKFIDWLMLGYDAERQALIFPLNRCQYVTLGFNGREFTQPPEERKKVLMHFNLEMEINGKDGFKPIQTNGCGIPKMPYLDNRFYGDNGEVVIAGFLGQEDKGKNLVTSGKVILPFPL